MVSEEVYHEEEEEEELTSSLGAIAIQAGF